MAAHYRCDRERGVGAALPALIADLHTSLAAGRDVAELLDLAVLLHTGATAGWLRIAGAPMDLREQAVRSPGRGAGIPARYTEIPAAGYGIIPLGNSVKRNHCTAEHPAGPAHTPCLPTINTTTWMYDALLTGNYSM
ncbi:MAG: hypothetical protein ACRDT0_01890 [Pseudonocardiaceae bacterium]